MKTKKIREVISSDVPSVTVPESWEKVKFSQFRDICKLFAADISATTFDSLLFLKLAGIRVIGFDSAEDESSSFCIVNIRGKFHMIGKDVGGFAVECVQWVHSVAPMKAVAAFMPSVHKSAIDPKMSGSSFGEFLAADNVYSGYVATGRADLADRLVRVAWPKLRKIRPWHRPAAVIWFSSLKNYLADSFQDLYSEADSSDIFAGNHNSPAAVKEAVNAQIRALTKGDITVEKEVLAAPLYRALTELDQLAKEYKELKNIGK